MEILDAGSLLFSNVKVYCRANECNVIICHSLLCREMDTSMKESKNVETLEQWKNPLSMDDLLLPEPLNNHPGLTMFLFVFTLISGVPFLIFLCFAVGSFVFMFISFVLIEGTLLALGTCVLASVLFVATFIALVVSMSLGTIWLVGTRWQEIMTECQKFIDKHFKQEQLTVAKTK